MEQINISVPTLFLNALKCKYTWFVLVIGSCCLDLYFLTGNKIFAPPTQSLILLSGAAYVYYPVFSRIVVTRNRSLRRLYIAFAMTLAMDVCFIVIEPIMVIINHFYASLMHYYFPLKSGDIHLSWGSIKSFFPLATGKK